MRQRIYIWIAVVIVLLFVFSCKTRYVPVEIKRTETVDDTTITERLVPYKDSTATRDTVSFLSNPYAYSWARYSGGILQHSLGIWPNSVLIVTVPHYMTVTKRIEVPKIVEVEKKLNWWQKTKIEIGGWSMIMNILLISMMIVRWLRKKKEVPVIYRLYFFQFSLSL